MRRSVLWKRLGILVVVLAFGSYLFVQITNRMIINATESVLYDEVSKIPPQRVALVLGTGKYMSDGSINLYFKNRIDAAEKLYKNGKIKYLLLSGDNSTPGYNEPEDMKQALLSRGIPEEHIFLDYAGFRTLDSVVRARDIFGLHTFIIVSQKFHNERAVYLAQEFGITASGFNAKDVGGLTGKRNLFREKLAKAKVFLDLWFGVDPKFGGRKMTLPQ